MKAMSERAFDDYIAEYPRSPGDTVDVDIESMSDLSGASLRFARITVNGRFTEAVQLLQIDINDYREAPMFQPYTKKPSIITAAQWDGTVEHAEKLVAAITEAGGQATWVNHHSIDGEPKPAAIVISTLEGDMDCTAGNWVVKGTSGEFYPVRDDIFRNLHEGF